MPGETKLTFEIIFGTGGASSAARWSMSVARCALPSSRAWIRVRASATTPAQLSVCGCCYVDTHWLMESAIVCLVGGWRWSGAKYKRIGHFIIFIPRNINYVMKLICIFTAVFHLKDIIFRVGKSSFAESIIRKIRSMVRRVSGNGGGLARLGIMTKVFLFSHDLNKIQYELSLMKFLDCL